jgi:hypothetical protein
MKKSRKSYSIYLSVLLLIALSIVFLPLDFFHNHETFSANTTTKQLNSSSKEDLNAKNNGDYCWVCAVHFDKTFSKENFIEKVRLSPAMSVFLNNEVTGYVVELLLSSLRGPPSE